MPLKFFDSEKKLLVSSWCGEGATVAKHRGHAQRPVLESLQANWPDDCCNLAVTGESVVDTVVPMGGCEGCRQA